MRIALAILVIAFSSPAASLTGAVVDPLGPYPAHPSVELDSGTNKYKAEADDAGVYRFSNLPSGEYTLTFRLPGYGERTIKSIRILEQEQKRLPDVPLDLRRCGSSPDLLLLPGEYLFGRLNGSVAPAAAGVEVTLVCRTFSPCRSTKTDSRGRFSFDMLSPGVYGLNFHRDGFYPENATGYAYAVSAGWARVYSPVRLERCRSRNCDPKLRPQRPIAICE
jgi:hypothetical protein